MVDLCFNWLENEINCQCNAHQLFLLGHQLVKKD